MSGQPVKIGVGTAATREPAWEEAPTFGRRETLVRTLRRLYELYPGPACIVETGTLRNDSPGGCSGDGWSTIAWGWYSARTGGKAYTVDVDGGALSVCRRMTADYAPFLEYVHADSRIFLRQWRREDRGEIHLLYLDSLDYIEHAASEAHHQEEAAAALPWLATPCLVLFDDTNRAEGPADVVLFTGKGARAVPFLLENGFGVEWAEGGQVLLSRGAIP